MILMYHNVAETAGFNTVSVSNMRTQLNYIAQSFHCVSLDDYITALPNGRETEKKLVTVTVDDAYRSFREVILPLLETYQIPVTLYVPVKHIASYNVWDSGREKIEIMSWSEITELAKHPLVTIGSHGMTHNSLGKMDTAGLRYEIMESKIKLEEKLSVKINHFSFPFGQICDYNSEALRILKKADYHSCCSTRFSNKNRIVDIFRLSRIEVEPGDSLADFRTKCTRYLHKKLWKRKIKESLYSLGLYRK